MASTDIQKSPLAIFPTAPGDRRSRRRDAAREQSEVDFEGRYEDPAIRQHFEDVDHPVRLHFADFEFRADSGELHRGGEVVRVQPQPARVLQALARRSGEVVSRKELQELVWGEDTHVDYDEGLNYCIKQLRRALGDLASRPSFIETVPRRGYRFLPQVRVTRSEPQVSIERESPSNWRPSATVPRVLVAPFLEIGRSMPFEGVGLTLTEELLAGLGEEASADTCILVRQPRGGDLPAGEADLAIEGSVRADGGSVEITVRLVELEHRQQLWTRRYSVDPTEEGAPGERTWDQRAIGRVVDDLVVRLGASPQPVR